MLQKDFVKVNTDIRGRFIQKRALQLSSINLNTTKNIWTSKTASRGDWIVTSKDLNFFIGRILNFKKSSSGTKSECLFWGDVFDLTKNGNVNSCFLLEPLFNVGKKKLVAVNRRKFQDDYFTKDSYVCHVSSEKIDISCLLSYINNNKK